jgi:xanthine dehydrogenase accessory factor
MDLLNLEGTDGILITAVNSEKPVQSHRYWVTGDESMESLPPDLQSHARAARASGRSTAQVIGGHYHLFQLISPAPVLHIFGAGHVGRAVAELAHFAELDVIVYDDRPDLANSRHFPYARQIIVDDFLLMSDQAPITNHDFVLIMTRGHQHDLQLLQWLLRKQVRYLGLMSSERKWRLLSKQLLSEGYTKEVVASVHAPVGLPIESETVPEIAISIIAQIIRVQRTGKTSD